MAQEREAPIINIRGKRIALGPVGPDLAPLLLRWANDFRTTRTLAGAPRPVTLAEQERVIDAVTADQSRVAFIVYALEDMQPVGVSNLFDLDDRHRTCEVDIGIMESSFRGKGLGAEAIRVATDYAIHGLGIHNVRLSVYGYNWAGYKAYIKAGFREYGRRREARLHNGEWWDIIYMDVIASEWERPVMNEMMTQDEERR